MVGKTPGRSQLLETSFYSTLFPEIYYTDIAKCWALNRFGIAWVGLMVFGTLVALRQLFVTSPMLVRRRQHHSCLTVRRSSDDSPLLPLLRGYASRKARKAHAQRFEPTHVFARCRNPFGCEYFCQPLQCLEAKMPSSNFLTCNFISWLPFTVLRRCEWKLFIPGKMLRRFNIHVQVSQVRIDWDSGSRTGYRMVFAISNFSKLHRSPTFPPVRAIKWIWISSNSIIVTAI